MPEVHITAAADELLTHLLATGEDVMAGEEGAFMTLARFGAQALMTRAEMEGTARIRRATERRAPAG